MHTCDSDIKKPPEKNVCVVLTAYVRFLLLLIHVCPIFVYGNAPCRSSPETSGGGLHEMGKGSVRAAIASEGYLSDDEFRLHNMHVHDQLLITKNDEHVEEISMKQ